ncbi:MAG: CotH kinase family protein [Eubacteriales bacterium]
MSLNLTKNKAFFLSLTVYIAILLTVFYLFSMISIQSESYALSNASEKTEMILGETIVFEVVQGDATYLAFEMGREDTFEIEFHYGEKSNSIVVNSGIWAEKEGESKPILHLIPEYITKLGFELISITPIRGDGDYFISNLELVAEDEISNYPDHNLIDFEIKQYHIELSDESYQVILDSRAEALELGVLHTDEESVVSGKVKAEGENYSADIRLKGDWTDHLQTDQWSYRIELKGDYCIYGLQKFSLQPIVTRNGIWEYLFYELYREQGGVAIRYDFADVYVNDVYLGVFAVEEFMEKRVVENSLNREGPIIRYNETAMWERWSYYNDLTAPIQEYTVFSENKTTQSENLNQYAGYAITMINKYIYQGEPVENVFDIEKYIQVYSIADLFSAFHGRREHNMRHYYNPVTALLEPIPFDEVIYQGRTDIFFQNDTYGSPIFIYSDIMENPENQAIAKEYLYHFAQDYPNFIERQQPQIDQFITTILRDNPDFYMNVWDVNPRIEQILTLDEPTEPVMTFEYVEALDSTVLNIENPNLVGIKLISVVQKDQSLPLDQNIVQNESPIQILLPYGTNPVTVEWETSFSDLMTTQVEVETSFFTVGHAYGAIEDLDNEIHPPLVSYLEQLTQETMDFGVFTGDISKYRVIDEYVQLEQISNEISVPFYAIPGNHDLDTAEYYDENEPYIQFYGVTYQYFIENNNIFFLLDVAEEGWHLPQEQMNLIKTVLNQNQNAQNIFVITHQLNWWNTNQEARFGSFAPNSTAGLTQDPPNFYDEVLPLFDGFDGGLYFIAGDTGAFANGNEIFYEKDRNITYLSNGVGGNEKDSVLKFDIYSNGSVKITLIPLNETQLGPIENYSRGG